MDVQIWLTLERWFRLCGSFSQRKPYENTSFSQWESFEDFQKNRAVFSILIHSFRSFCSSEVLTWEVPLFFRQNVLRRVTGRTDRIQRKLHFCDNLRFRSPEKQHYDFRQYSADEVECLRPPSQKGDLSSVLRQSQVRSQVTASEALTRLAYFHEDARHLQQGVRLLKNEVQSTTGITPSLSLAKAVFAVRCDLMGFPSKHWNTIRLHRTRPRIHLKRTNSSAAVLSEVCASIVYLRRTLHATSKMNTVVRRMA